MKNNCASSDGKETCLCVDTMYLSDVIQFNKKKALYSRIYLNQLPTVPYTLQISGNNAQIIVVTKIGQIPRHFHHEADRLYIYSTPEFYVDGDDGKRQNIVIIIFSISI